MQVKTGAQMRQAVCEKSTAASRVTQKRRRWSRRRFHSQNDRWSAVRIASIVADARTYAAWRPIDWRWLLARAAEQKTKEASPVAIAPAATAIHANRHAHRLGRRIRPMLDRDIGDLALAALEDGDHPGVAAIDVLAQLQLAVLVHKGGLVGQMDPDVLGEVDVDLAAAEHPLQSRLGVVLARQHQ